MQIQNAHAPEAKPAPGLMLSLSSTLTNGWSALGSMLSVNEQDLAVKDWYARARRLTCDSSAYNHYPQA